MIQQKLTLNSAGELRSKIHTTQRFWASARASVKMPVTAAELQ